MFNAKRFYAVNYRGIPVWFDDKRDAVAFAKVANKIASQFTFYEKDPVVENIELENDITYKCIWWDVMGETPTAIENDMQETWAALR